jgi:DNA recombination protein RmuC
MTEVGATVLAFVVGGALVWLLRSLRGRSELAALETQFALLRQQQAERGAQIQALQSDHAGALEALRAESSRRAAAEQKAARVPELEAALTAERRSLAEVQAKLAESETRLASERKSAEEKLALLAEAERKLTHAFDALSSNALKSNNQAFLELARTQLGELEKARIGAYAALNEQLKGLVETHLPMLRSETANLVKALRQPTVRGRWGEMQLKRVVEMAGMLDHCDFLEQESRTTEDGRLRPDLVVRLPGGKQVVVDAKAPVSAYLDAAESGDETTQRTRLADHAQQVRAHMTALGRKAYWEQFDPAPEFVVLFLRE